MRTKFHTGWLFDGVSPEVSRLFGGPANCGKTNVRYFEVQFRQPITSVYADPNTVTKGVSLQSPIKMVRGSNVSRCLRVFQLSGEVTYAELCLARPTTLATSGLDSKMGVIVGGKPYTKEATVYACIDHTVRPPPSIGHQQQQETGLITPGSGILSGKHHPREVVTVRTPLISTQESCV